MCACNNGTDWMEIAGIIVAAVIPVIIMRITLISDKKKHLEQMAQVGEKNRIDAMPLIELGEPVLDNMVEDGEVIINTSISIMNVGNGTAANVTISDNGIGRLGNLLPGQATDLIGLSYRQKSVEEVHRIQILFLDLYGNHYSQTIGLKPQKQSGFWRIVCTEIELPVIVAKGNADE